MSSEIISKISLSFWISCQSYIFRNLIWQIHFLKMFQFCKISPGDIPLDTPSRLARWHFVKVFSPEFNGFPWKNCECLVGIKSGEPLKFLEEGGYDIGLTSDYDSCGAILMHQVGAIFYCYVPCLGSRNFHNLRYTRVGRNRDQIWRFFSYEFQD